MYGEVSLCLKITFPLDFGLLRLIILAVLDLDSISVEVKSYHHRTLLPLLVSYPSHQIYSNLSILPEYSNITLSFVYPNTI